MTATSAVPYRLEFTSNPAEFLETASAYLQADPVVSTVVTSVTHGLMAEAERGAEPPEDRWWLIVRAPSGEILGVAMRTAPFSPRPPFLLPMPDGAAEALAHVLYGRGEEVAAVNGSLPAVQRFAAEYARLAGARVEVSMRTRLHELGELVVSGPVPGRLVPASEEHADLAVAWFEAFMGDADEQAGRPRGSGHSESVGRDEMLRRIRGGQVWFWLDEAGEPVHMTGANPPSFGVARVGPVYTPPSQRGRGWASAAVAEVSRILRDGGARVCLYTDQANPTSNRIYEALGYRPVVDMANLVLVDGAGQTG